MKLLNFFFHNDNTSIDSAPHWKTLLLTIIYAIVLMVIMYVLRFALSMPLLQIVFVSVLMLGVFTDIKQKSWVLPTYLKYFSWQYVLLILCIFVHLTTLFEGWKSGNWQQQYNLSLGNYFPLNDGTRYFKEILYYISGLKILGVASLKPISTVFYGWWYNLFNGNEFWFFMSFNLMCSLALYAAATGIKKVFGAAAAILYIYCNGLYIMEFMGSSSTEMLGYLLGNIALVFAGAALLYHSPKYALWAFAFLIIALSTRPSSMFFIPIWLLFFGYLFFKFKTRYTIYAAFVIVLLVSFSINPILNRWKAEQNTHSSFSNFALVLYALASNNGPEHWKKYRKDNPNTGVFNYEKVYDDAIQKIKQKPSNIIKTVFRYMLGGFLQPVSFLYPYLPNEQILYRLLAYTFWGSVVLLFFLMYKRRLGDYQNWVFFQLLCVLASILSRPFVTGGYRSYAAVFPFHCLLLSVGVGIACRLVAAWLKDKTNFRLSLATTPISTSTAAPNPVMWLLAALVLTTLVLSPLTPYHSFLQKNTPTNALAKRCQHEVVVFPANRSLFVNFLPTHQRTFAPAIKRNFAQEQPFLKNQIKNYRLNFNEYASLIVGTSKNGESVDFMNVFLDKHLPQRYTKIITCVDKSKREYYYTGAVMKIIP